MTPVFAGSNPAIPAIYSRLAQLVRAPDLSHYSLNGKMPFYRGDASSKLVNEAKSGGSVFDPRGGNQGWQTCLVRSFHIRHIHTSA